MTLRRQDNPFDSMWIAIGNADSFAGTSEFSLGDFNPVPWVDGAIPFSLSPFIDETFVKGFEGNYQWPYLDKMGLAIIGFDGAISPAQDVVIDLRVRRNSEQASLRKVVEARLNNGANNTGLAFGISPLPYDLCKPVEGGDPVVATDLMTWRFVVTQTEAVSVNYSFFAMMIPGYPARATGKGQLPASSYPAVLGT